MSAFWVWLICASADATSGDIVDPPIVLPTGGTIMVAMVWWVLAVLVLSSSCVTLKIAYGLALVYQCYPDVGCMLMALRRRVNASWKKFFIVAHVCSGSASQSSKSLVGKTFAFRRTMTAFTISCLLV